MQLNSITAINNLEIEQVAGGRSDYRNNLLYGALSSCSIKTTAYWITLGIPDGTKGTFKGELWNGLKKGLSSALSALSWGIAGHYITLSIQSFPGGEDNHAD